ncbi:MAG: hypothetical protein C4308_00690 [Chitinophagaceae bacterium]
MKKQLLISGLLLFCFGLLHAQEKPLTKGMKITRSTKIKKATYKLDAFTNWEKPVILIEGENITVDFNNAVLTGSNTKKNPDEFFGVAIIIQNSNRITIKNLKAKGYKVAILAKNVTSLTIDNCDLCYNYRQHLNSTQEKEDISDWMSYHHNENDEWLRYGAAIYLRDCNMAIISNNKVTGGQNALMMTNCNDGFIYNNDFSFNSGIGLGMYRCSYNEIAYNKLDFNVRGYSHGVYSRGQDSAGILIYEQSNNNLFFKNSVTHSGDGFFLWAGQTTMDNGQGGCNDNTIFGNDFSYAPTNGIEVTFSRNKILNNRVFECDHGIWGGYSYQTEIANNQFRNNNIAIAIEHGQQNEIHHNLFLRDKTAIKLWARKEQPADWGYAKYRDTKSHGYIIVANSFNENKTAIDAIRTDSLVVFGNIHPAVENFIKVDSTVTNIDSTVNEELNDRYLTDTMLTDPPVQNPIDPFKGRGILNGRKNILITEWGPYDFQSPIIWNTNPTDTSSIMQFDIKGPKGKWKLKSVKGVEGLSSTAGTVPATITAKKITGDRTDIRIELEFVGEQVITPFGQIVAKGKSYRFSFEKFFQPINWIVNWFAMDTASYNPIKTGELFAPNVRVRPVKTDTVNRVDYAWWGGLKTTEGQLPQFITVAEGIADVLAGKYELSTTWDDAVRIYIDDKLVLNEWNPSLYKFDESPNKKIQLELAAGKHNVRVEHLELGGFATISIRLKKL